MPAAGAGPRLASLFGRVAAEDPFLLALRADGVFAIGRVSSAPQVLQARGIIRKLAQELHQRVRGLRAGGPARSVAIYRRHTVRLLDVHVFVK